MADEGGDRDRSQYLREDFDPLADYGPEHHGKEEFVTEVKNYEYEDDDGDPDSLTFHYGTTPPQPRSAKREKERGTRGMFAKRPNKEQKEFLSKRRNQPRSVLKVIKDAHTGAPALCGLSGFDSDDNLDREILREKREKTRKDSRDTKKSQSKNRTFDRSVKRMSDEFALMDVNNIAQSNVKLESSGRFSHLLAKPMVQISAENRGIRTQWQEPAQCPRDRVEFSKTFSLLINLGTQAKKDKERKLATTKRQMSSEMEMLQAQFMDIMWVELNAYLHGWTFEEEQTALRSQRDGVQVVLDAIMNFQFQHQGIPLTPNDSAFSSESDLSSLRNVRAYSNNASESILRRQPEDSISASFHDVTLSSETIHFQEEALVQVRHLLDRLDTCERWYPTMKQLGAEYSLYLDPVFTLRVKCLYLWLNITCDLCHKIKLFGRIIGAEQRGIDWPVINFDFAYPSKTNTESSQHQSVPDIAEHDESSSDESAEEEGSEATGENGHQLLSPIKQVKFTFGSDSTKSSRDASPCQRTGSVVEPLSPQDCSTPSRNSRSSIVSVATTLSRASSDVSLDEVGRSAVYRHYVDRCLKKMGMHRLVIHLRDFFDCTLQRAKEALQNPRQSSSAVDLKRHSSDEAGLHETEISSSPSLAPPVRVHFGRCSSLTEHGEWCQEFRRMGLPSFRPSYLFLVRIPLDIVHECLRLRLEQRPLGEPSFLSIRQLIRECKEVLRGATLVKQYYQFMVESVMWDEQEAEDKFASDLDQFDADLRSMLEAYFSFLQSWIYMLQSLPEGSQDLKSALEDEWDFIRTICIYIIGGEAEAGKRFSVLASSLLTFTADFLDNGIDENTRSLYDSSGLEEDDRDGNSNNSDGLPSIDCDDVPMRPRISAEVKQSVQIALRSFKNLFHEARERATKALGFAKRLRKDLEIAADFNINVTTMELFEKLQQTDHVRVRAPLSTGYMMFVPQGIVGNTRLILQLLNVTSGRDDSSHPTDLTTRDDGYLLLVCCEAGKDRIPQCPRWTGQDVIVEPTAETTIALSHIQVEGLLYVVIHSSLLGNHRKEFEQLMGDTLVLVSEQTPCHQAIAESLSELKLNAVELQEKVILAIQQIDDKLNFNDIIQYEDNLLKLYRETMLQCFNFGFEYSKEVMRLISSDQRKRLCQTLVEFACNWMRFVLQKCERGRGTRPRWATQGLDFLTVVCDPKFLAYLTVEEFEKFKLIISDCLTHIIGTSEQRHIAQGISVTRPSSDLSIRQPSYQRFISWPEQARFVRSPSSRSVSCEPTSSAISSGQTTPATTPSPQAESSRTRRLIPESHSEVNIHDGDDGGIVLDIYRQKHRASTGDLQIPLPRRDKIQKRIQQLEETRDIHLQEKRRIGRVADKVQEPDYRISVRRVNFRWQRGIKIGEGQFGKVYTAVNMMTGELMAMKEMKFQPNDLQQLREMSDEIKMFEGIQHPNLVKYYGVEVHKDEMLMFMEYCDTGTIEEAAKMGLPEYLIRRYTREIVLAVNHLHENSIVHRDIKGANIFLTSKGHVKLGDFGCSVKLKSHTTMPGEFINMVGTTAYMAPEVITEGEHGGHGRAADIWSIGCVVIEMATGKRPWHEAENNYQIMFKVGMGYLPTIPESMSFEGKDFLNLCLKHDASQRATASELLDHTFTKVDNEQEE